MNSAIADKIAVKRRQLAELERSIELLRVEIATYEDALSLVELTRADSQSARTRSRQTAVSTNQRVRRERGISPSWRTILERVGRNGPQPVDLDDIARFARDAGLDVSSANLRSQMASYNKRGWLERVRPGRYKLSPAGQQIVGVRIDDLLPESGNPEPPKQSVFE
jgi:hypothetical protein